jgi:hypothetical protein
VFVLFEKQTALKEESEDGYENRKEAWGLILQKGDGEVVETARPDFLKKPNDQNGVFI